MKIAYHNYYIIIIISYHIISYHIISYHITSHHITSYHIISYHIIYHNIFISYLWLIGYQPFACSMNSTLFYQVLIYYIYNINIIIIFLFFLFLKKKEISMSETLRAKTNNLRQLCSSLTSPQSLSPSQTHVSSIHLPVAHLNSFVWHTESTHQ